MPSLTSSKGVGFPKPGRATPNPEARGMNAINFHREKLHEVEGVTQANKLLEQSKPGHSFCVLHCIRTSCNGKEAIRILIVETWVRQGSNANQ